MTSQSDNPVNKPCILTEEQLEKIEDVDFMVSTKDEDGNNAIKTLPKEQICATIRDMIDVMPAANLVSEGLCNAGAEYNNWSLFHTVQKNVIRKNPKLNFGGTSHLSIVRIAWGMIGMEKKDQWKAETTAIKKMTRTAPKGRKRHKQENHDKYEIRCPVCFVATTVIAAHLRDTHFPNWEKESEVGRMQLKACNDILEGLAVNKQLAKKWNVEFVNFYEEMYMPEEDRSELTNQRIQEARVLIDKAMSGENKFGEVYFQVKIDENGKEVLHHIGTRLQEELCEFPFPFFNPDLKIGGRVGEEHKRAFEKNEKVYFWSALQNIPTSMCKTLKFLLVSAFRHLTKGKSICWNVKGGKFSNDGDFRSIDPKSQIFTGLVLLHDLREQLKAAFDDGSLFNSLELLSHVPIGPERNNYISRCGKEERVEVRQSGTAKRRKVQFSDDSNDEDPNNPNDNDPNVAKRNSPFSAEPTSQNTNLTSQIASLTSQIASMTTENNALATENYVLNNQIIKAIQSIQGMRIQLGVGTSPIDPQEVDKMLESIINSMQPS